LATPSKDIDVLKYSESLKNYLRSQEIFKDYDFEGTNLSVLINLLAYNAFNMAHYDHMVGSEAWIDTAELRQSLVSHATDLNYLPRSRISAQSVLEVEIFPDDQPQTIILPKYYRFKTNQAEGTTLYFVTNQDYVAARSNEGRYIFTDVNVYEGNIIEEYFDVDGVTSNNGITTYSLPFVISSSNIDISSLEVFVSTNSGANYEKYTYAKTLGETTNETHTYFLRGVYDDQYAIEFGDGTFGKPIANGNRVLAKYRDSLGPVVQGNYVLTKTAAIDGYSDIVINSSTRVQGGFERESIEELRRNAPRYYQTQDRAVTGTDYEVIIKQAFPNIQQVSAFGGEEIQQYGKVIIVLKPYGTSGIVSNNIKSQIINLLREKNIVPEPIIIDPVYFYVGVNGNVYYRGDIANLPENQIKTNCVAALTNLNNSAIGDFNINIYQSLINDTIITADSAITGTDVILDIRKRWNPTLNINETLNFFTNNELDSSLDGPYQTTDDYTIVSTRFNIVYNSAITNVIIQDDGIGNLFYFNVSTTGKKIKIGQPIGTINYDTGEVDLVSNVYSYTDYGPYIEFRLKLKTKSISAIRESFMIIAGEDINLSMKRI